MFVKLTHFHEYSILSLNGKINGFSALQLMHEFRTLLSQYQGLSTWIFDLSKFEIADSTGLGAFVECLKRANAEGKSVKLAEVQSKSQGLLKVSRIHYIFKIYPSLEEAIKATPQKLESGMENTQKCLVAA